MGFSKHSFDTIINGSWEKHYPYDGDGPGARVMVQLSENEKQDVGIPFVMPTVWDEFMPLTMNLNKEDIVKFYNMFFYAKDMFKYLQGLDDPKAKEIVNKIVSDNEIPQDQY